MKEGRKKGRTEGGKDGRREGRKEGRKDPSAVHVRAVFVVFVVVHLRCCSLALGAHKRVVRTAVSNGGKTAEGGERARRGSFHPHTL